MLIVLMLTACGPAWAAPIVLSWTAPSSGGPVATYHVERRTDTAVTCPGTTSAFAEIGTPAATVTTFTDTTVVDGTIYCYRVRAANLAGFGPYSNVAGKLAVPALPGAVQNLLLSALPPAPRLLGLLVSGMDHTTPRPDMAALMTKAQGLGTTWVRSDFWWYSAEWVRGQWTWDYFDAVVEEVTGRGMRVIPILWGTPTWAAMDGMFAYGVPELAAWETFVRQTVTRYRGRVTVWEVWNEPDTTLYWKGTPAQYAALLARAYTAIKAVDPTAEVWLGGLAQGGDFVVPGFLEAIVAAGATASVDAVNIHTNFRTMAQITQQVTAAKAAMPGKRVVATEASYTSDPAWQPLPGYQDGEAGQARYLTDAYRTMVAAGVTVAVWAGIDDYPITERDPYAGSGLLRRDGSAKPAAAAFRMAGG